MQQRVHLRATLHGTCPQQFVVLPSVTLALLIIGSASFFTLGSQFDYSPYKWDMLCDSGSHFTGDRR
jgi:hypothetical protein